MMPALLTRTTGGPSSSATRATPLSTCPAFVTSTATPVDRPPASRIRPATASHDGSSRSSTPTANPSLPSRSAVAAPMPRAAPVTMATRSGDMRLLWKAEAGDLEGELPTLPTGVSSHGQAGT